MSGRGPKPPPLPPCDQCLHRKVKCDKSLPKCYRCADASLPCTREVIRRRPGRKKGSGQVISRLRIPPALDPHGSTSTSTSTETGDQGLLVGPSRGQQAEASGTLHFGSENASQLILVDERSPRQDSAAVILGVHPPVSPQSSHLADSPSKLSAFGQPEAVLSNFGFLSRYIDLFFQKLYPIWPIIDEASFRESLSNLEQLDLQTRCLILSICALTALHVPSLTPHGPESRRVVAQRFIEQCRQLRLTFDYLETADISTVQTSLFLSCAEVEFQKLRVSWFLLQEAIMLARELGFYGSKGLSPGLSKSEVLSHQRTLFLLLLTERGLTILRNKPFSIMKFDNPLEDRFENEDPCILIGLQCFSQLFNLLDEQFLDTWVNGSQSKTPSEAAAKVLSAQLSLANMRFDVGNLTDIQKADVLITQQWFRLVFWQYSMRQGLLSSSAEDPVFSYQFPCQIAKSLCFVLESISTFAIFTHGMAIFERVFEIAYSYIDSLSLSNSLLSGIDQIRIIFRVLRASPNSHETYIQILEAKLVEQAGENGSELIPLIYQQ